MRFYAACLASYNNGVLHGRWIDASSDVDEMQAEVSAMLRESRFPNVTVKHPETDEMVPSAEEWAIHDYEDLPSCFGEYAGIKAIAEFVELTEEHSMEAENLSAIVSHFGSVAYAKEELADRFVGRYESLRAYADEMADEMLAAHDIKSDHPLAQYFDYEQYAHELRHSVTEVDLSDGVGLFC
ncbi:MULTISPECIES: antirestriction protein ArdA [unclassified Rhizobium]|uniref:antirestriction protein ArdA n=1 Tax=unclassified Rhizobium TaxID=2613769 RepID=UPI00177BC781|nr:MULTISPECIES: antirestriction protein ArdA [unclassified Rhizobium]MBD8687066.1 antirestriction protein ArdA [Rhizobium sp. CFBP 13644]MBD8691131.1 antirestriction protein ArdA [Rhizobium sp. CFBP 13717]